MKKQRIIIICLLTFFWLNQALAQSHDFKGCRFNKDYNPTTEGYSCKACVGEKQKEKAAKVAEDKRVVDERITYGALAIDRNNGFFYGWSYDYLSLAEAEKKAIEECNKKGGNCSVVLSFSGAGCAAYRTVNGDKGTAYGWGLSKTKQEADEIAKKECIKRSKGLIPSNYVWACNSITKVELKEIYNAKDEISNISDSIPLGSTHAAVFSLDGKKLATGSDNGIIRIWAMPSFNLISIINSNPENAHFHKALDLVFSPDGKVLVSGTGDRHGKIKIWDIASRKLLKILDFEWGNDPALSFSPDGKFLASNGDCSWNGKSCPGIIYVWEVATWELYKTFSGHGNNIRSTAFTPDSKTLASSSVDGTVVFWDVQTGNKIRRIDVTKDQVAKGEFSPDGKSFITIAWSVDPKIKLWDASTGNLIKTLPGHGVFGESISYYLDSKKVVSIGGCGGSCETLILWDLNTGNRLASVNLDYTDWNLGVSRDGLIASTGAGGLQLWKFDQNGNLSLWKQLK
jgi:WD40 repeat protein